jgi:hypothetical protein
MKTENGFAPIYIKIVQMQDTKREAPAMNALSVAPCTSQMSIVPRSEDTQTMSECQPTTKEQDNNQSCANDTDSNKYGKKLTVSCQKI